MATSSPEQIAQLTSRPSPPRARDSGVAVLYSAPAQLAAADAVLRAVLFDDSSRQRAARLPRP